MSASSAVLWWTLADAAEQEALVRVLVDEVFGHREAGCERCSSGETCPAVRGAIEVVVDWRAQRALVSRAQWLRAQQQLAELAEDIADREAA